MKSRMLLFAVLVFSGSVLMAQSNLSKDEIEIKGLVQSLADGLIKKQPAMMGEVLADNVLFITPSGVLLNTKEEVVAYHVEAVKMIPPSFTFTVNVDRVHFIRPDLAIAHIKGEGSMEMNGQKIEDIESAGITAMKVDGAWKIIHFGSTRIMPQG